MSERSKPLVLIVDDDPDIARFIEVNLRSAGFNTTIAEDGLIGLEKVDEEGPDLVLTGIMMPRLDGFEMIRRIRKRAYRGPIIVCSAKALDQDIETARELGADAYAVKPFDPSLLVELIRRHLAAVGSDDGPGWSVHRPRGASSDR